jgi:uncharacterized membrane protein
MGAKTMEKIKRIIHIDAPVNKVFEFIDEPENLPEIWPSMIKVDNVERSATKGRNYDWQYKMAGMPFNGHSETTEYVPNEHAVVETKEGIRSKFVWDYHAENGGTELKLAIEYTVPVPLLGKLAEKVIRRINENEADVMLANLKAAVEP